MVSIRGNVNTANTNFTASIQIHQYATERVMRNVASAVIVQGNFQDILYQSYEKSQ